MTIPVKVINWYDLENIKIYYDLFKENEELFIKPNKHFASYASLLTT
jgi:hypothetical protein